ncbi:MAG: hypothetical protein CV087_22990 [Candidatus Brocadia sp. WS118]|nr:MAG: hypothetical protein CV087_22990 [Candidatus Brocadia sp. WS118]
MKKNEISLDDVVGLKQLVHILMPIDVLVRVEDYQKRNRIDTRTRAILQLIETGMLLEKHKDTLEDHELKQEIEQSYKNGSFVDFVSRMTPRDFKIFHSIVENENKARFQNK